MPDPDNGGRPHFGKAEPRFDIDYKYGRQGELLVGTFLEWIANGNGRVEIKHKKYLDLEFYVETHHDPGRTGEYVPSGINVTEAECYAFVIGDTGISVLIPTIDLKAMVTDPMSKDRECPRGSCPTRGRMINLGALLYRHQRRLQYDIPPLSRDGR